MWGSPLHLTGHPSHWYCWPVVRHDGARYTLLDGLAQSLVHPQYILFYFLEREIKFKENKKSVKTLLSIIVLWFEFIEYVNEWMFSLLIKWNLFPVQLESLQYYCLNNSKITTTMTVTFTFYRYFFFCKIQTFFNKVSI